MDIDSVVRFYKEGSTLREIGEAFGVSKQRIDQVLAKAGVERRPRGKLTDDVKNKVRELSLSGKNYDEISAEIGFSTTTVFIILKELGLVRKDKEYRCRKCGGTIYRKNGSGRICVPCSNKRANEYYHAHKPTYNKDERNEPKYDI